jgi:hypothetical protein
MGSAERTRRIQICRIDEMSAHTGESCPCEINLPRMWESLVFDGYFFISAATALSVLLIGRGSFVNRSTRYMSRA